MLDNVLLRGCLNDLAFDQSTLPSPRIEMLTPTTFTQFVAAHGRPMSEINPGSNEIALSPSDAIKGIDLLRGSKVAVLGGDVLAGTSGKIAYTYRNWYCEQRPNETPMEFCHRSQVVARDLIEKLLEHGEKHVFVVLVHSELGIV